MDKKEKITQIQKKYEEVFKQFCEDILVFVPKNYKLYFLAPSEAALIEFLRELEYGEVTIKVHDGRPSITERIIERKNFKIFDEINKKEGEV